MMDIENGPERKAAIERIKNVISRFEFRGGLRMWHPTIEFDPTVRIGHDAILLYASILVQDINTYITCPISTIIAIDYGLPSHLIEKEILKGLREAFIHEIDEGIWIDGEQACNPHSRPSSLPQSSVELESAESE